MPKRNPLAERLKLVAATRSQAEIARKTGTSGPNVSRYLTGTRVPADFCTALVEQFGVNPGWLLTGKGAPYTAEIAASGEQLAGSLLELVEAMDTVARMRLGAVSGQGRVLRELHDATLRYEQLRDRLNGHSRPVLERLLDQLGEKMARRRVDEAEVILRTAEQVALFCADDTLRTGVNSFRAEISFVRGRRDDALRQQEEVVMHMLLGNRVHEETTFIQVFNLASALIGRARFAAARRITGAALALCEDAHPRWRAVPLLRAMLGLVDLELGNIERAVARLHRALADMPGTEPETTPDTMAYQRGHYFRAQLLSGAMSLDMLLAHPELKPWNHYNAVSHALLHERRDALERLCRDFAPGGSAADATAGLVFDAAHRMLEALGDKRRGALARFDKTAQAALAADAAPWHRFAADALRAQIAWAAGQRSEAAAASGRAAATLAELGPDLTPPLELRATHYRTLLRLGDHAGDAFFAGHIEAGYRALESVRGTAHG